MGREPGSFTNPWSKLNRIHNLQFQRLAFRLLIALTIGGTIISACSNTSSSLTQTPGPTLTGTTKPVITQTAAPIPSATIPVELSKLKGTDIRLIHPWSGEASTTLRRLIAEFNNENIWGIRVTDIQGGSVTETARAFTDSMVTSERINLIAISPEYLAGWNSGGFTIDLSPYISNTEWGIPIKEKSTYFSEGWKSNRMDGVQIGIPAQINLHILVYNRTWANELGFTEAPRTRDEFLTQVCEAARTNNQDSDRENDGTGGWIINSGSSTLLSWIHLFSEKGFAVDSPENAIRADETGEAFTYLRELTEKGCAWSSRVASPFTYFATRQTLAFSATLPDLLELEQMMKFGENTDEWEVLPYPDNSSESTIFGTGLSYGISKTDDIQELASWLFLRWLTLPQNQARMAEAAGTIPPTTASGALMETYGASHNWWTDAYEMAQDAVFIQTSPDWQKARPVLEDGFWQMLQPTPMPIPTLLHQMDETFRSFVE